MRVAVRVSPGPALAGHWELRLEQAVVLLELAIVDGPVGADTVVRESPKVGGMEPGRIAGEVHHRAPDPPSRVVAAELDWVRARDHPGLVPVQLVRAGLVAHPVLVGVPEGPGVEHHDVPPVPSQPLRQDGASGTAPDDHDIDVVIVPVATHVASQSMVGPGSVVRQQPRRLVASLDAVHGSSSGAWRAASGEDIPSACLFLAASARSTQGTGSSASRSATSHGSRAPRARFL